MIQDKDLIKKCINEIESKLNWVDSKQWQQKHFDSLNELILEKTQVSLSPLTLKRLWGKVKYNSTPSVTTLDALAKFLEYNDWIDYQCSQNGKKINLNFGFLKSKRVLIISSLILGLLIVSIAIVKLPVLLTPKNYSDVEFSVQKLSSGLPNTVYFSYNAINTDADSVFIQQTWDHRKRQKVDKNKTIYSGIYYYPGFYKAKLVLDDSIVSKKELYIKSNGWLGLISKKPIPNYLPFEKISNEGTLEIKEEHLIEAGYNLRNEIPQSTIKLVEEFKEIKGDNFKIITDFKQTYPKGEAICKKSAINISCSQGYFYIPFSIKGCINELSIHVPGTRIKAKDNDLRHLGNDNDDFIHVELEVLNSNLNLTVNHIPVITDLLIDNPGKIVGMEYGFHGTGIVKSFELISEKQQYNLSDFYP